MFKKRILIFLSFRWLWLSFCIFLLDFISKQYIKNILDFGEFKSIVPFVNICYVYNYGIAFGLFTDYGRQRCYLLISISILIVFLFLFIMCYVNYHNKLLYISYSMVVGGAFGNIFDRILYGGVTDFIDIYLGKWHWPTFNIADIMILIGMLLIMFHNKSYLKK